MEGWSSVIRELVLVPGTGGVYDLEIDGSVVYSKRALGHRSYPTAEDLLPTLRAALGPERT
jgi:predicted Rdx family selenoprotein